MPENNIPEENTTDQSGDRDLEQRITALEEHIRELEAQLDHHQESRLPNVTRRQTLAGLAGAGALFGMTGTASAQSGSIWVDTDGNGLLDTPDYNGIDVSAVHTVELLVNNRQVYIQDTEPTSPQNGDVWISSGGGVPSGGGGGADTTPPAVPTLSENSHTDTSVTISATGSSDTDHFTLYRGGSSVADFSGTYTDTGLTASTSYDYTATATDTASNESARSNTVTVTTNAAGGGGGSTPTLIEDFESGSVPSGYGGATGSFEVQSGTVIGGSYSLHATGNGYLSDNNVSTAQGGRYRGKVRMTGSRPAAGFLYFTQAETNARTGYRIRANHGDGNFQLQAPDGTLLDSASYPVAAGTTYLIEFGADTSGQHTATLYDETGSTQYASLTATDTQATSGGFGFYSYEGYSGNQGECYYDDIQRQM